MEVECIRCGCKNIIEWQVKGFNLYDMVISFDCKECRFPMLIQVEFLKDKQEIEIIKREKVNYIG